MEVIFIDNDLEKFITSLERSTVAKVLRTIDLLEQFGNNLSLPHSKKITKHLFELRIHGAQEVRIFYTFHKNSAVLLVGFKKKTQRIPRNIINLALKKIKLLDEI